MGNLVACEPFTAYPAPGTQRLCLEKCREIQKETELTSERQRCVLPDTLDFSFCAWGETNTHTHKYHSYITGKSNYG